VRGRLSAIGSRTIGDGPSNKASNSLRKSSLRQRESR
jgi:hypothetical protein